MAASRFVVVVVILVFVGVIFFLCSVHFSSLYILEKYCLLDGILKIFSNSVGF